jgi:hypothetical protein
MTLSTWQWLILAAFGAAFIFRLGMWFGRGVAEAERIGPISTTRISPEARAQIEDALRRGDKIEAIKILRLDTECSLVEAKKTVEALQLPGA